VSDVHVHVHGSVDLQLKFVLTYSMVQDILWKAESACQTTACFRYGTRRFITVVI